MYGKEDAMDIIKIVKEYHRINAAIRELEAEKAELIPYIDEAMNDAEHVGRNWVKTFGKIMLTFIPKSRESISAKKVREQAPELFEELERLGLVSTSEFIERRTKEV